MASRDAGLRELQDREAFRELMARYARGVDRRDYALVGSVFADDAYLKYGDLWEGAGVDNILAFVRRVERFPVTMHFMGNQDVSLQGDAASMTTYCVAHHRFERDGRQRLLVLGIRYVDELRRLAQGWRVQHRIMHVDWSEEQEASS